MVAVLHYKISCETLLTIVTLFLIIILYFHIADYLTYDAGTLCLCSDSFLKRWLEESCTTVKETEDQKNSILVANGKKESQQHEFFRTCLDSEHTIF